MSFINKLSLTISAIGQFWQENLNGLIFRWNIFFILLQLLILFVKFNDLPPEIPLYYSLPWGKSQLAPISHIFFLPTLSIVILMLNHFLAVSYLRSIQLLSKLLIIISLIYSAFSSIALFQIIRLVT